MSTPCQTRYALRANMLGGILLAGASDSVNQKAPEAPKFLAATPPVDGFWS